MVASGQLLWQCWQKEAVHLHKTPDLHIASGVGNGTKGASSTSKHISHARSSHANQWPHWNLHACMEQGSHPSGLCAFHTALQHHK